MGRLMAIDYGAKRIGLAVSDPMQIIATSLDTVSTKGIFEYLKIYNQKEGIDAFIVGMPKQNL
jgi:putative Holliday junction resolvase